jgi:Protein of unknown function (DUF2867)
MPEIAPQEYLAQPLRVHSFLRDVELHDVWVADLPAVRGGATLREFYERTKRTTAEKRISWPARALFGLRFFLGRIFGWDEEPQGCGQEYFAERLTPEDREHSSVPAGTPEKFFRMVYSFENETLLEVINGTVHAALLSALVEVPHGYRFYFAVYVRERSWITPVYMALIDPFRKWFVYPEVLLQVQRNWARAFHCNEGEPGGITER